MSEGESRQVQFATHSRSAACPETDNFDTSLRTESTQPPTFFDRMATTLPHTIRFPGLDRTTPLVDRFGLTVVVPAYNEFSRLPRTLDGLAEWASSREFGVEILVVDDGSHDATAEVAARHPCGCGVIRLAANSGKGAAVRTGMLVGQGAVVAFTDADLPYRLDALEQAHSLIAEGAAEVVYGGRDLAESAEAVSRARSRSLASVCYRRFASRLVSRDVPDTQCGLKAYSHAAAWEVFSRVQTNGFAFDAEAIFVARRLGLTSARVPVVLVNEAGSTVSLRRHAAAMVRDVVKARLRHWRAAGLPTATIPAHEFLRRAGAPLPQRRAA